MNEEVFVLLRRYRRPLIVSVGLFFAVYIGWTSLASNGATSLPSEFWVARSAIVETATEIVGLSTEARDSVERIVELESAGRNNEALALIRIEVERIQDVREDGSTLLAELSKMAEGVTAVRSSSLRADALAAIGHEVGMVNNIILYTDGLEQILRLLTSKVLYGDAVTDALHERAESVNAAVKAVREHHENFENALSKIE